jgi:hypothetical protein
MPTCFSRIILSFATLAAAIVAWMPAATAEIIQISAITFVVRERDPALGLGVAQQGVLTDAKGIFYAAVNFPANGQRVCKFSLVYRDNDADSQTLARLLKKKIILGDVPFTPPVLMAGMNTGIATGAMGVKRKSLTAITEPIIDLNNAFYYVEIQNTSTLLEVLGVEIDVRQAC